MIQRGFIFLNFVLWHLIIVMSIEDKQTFLKESILERGINPEDFFEFWQNL